MRPRVLLLNPPVHDLAAYDFWARPLGLLTLGAALRRHAEPVLLDALDPRSPWLPAGQRPARRSPGRGRFARAPLPMPPALREAAPKDRSYARYGLSPEQLTQALASLPRPEAVLVTCGMTHWYPGAVEAIRIVRRRWRGVPVVLGGVYATLCPGHAGRHGEAERVAPGPLEQALPVVGQVLGLELAAPEDETPPAHELAPRADAAALRTSVGCPLRCAYCGVHLLQPRHRTLPDERVVAEAAAIRALGIRDVAIYDDALLVSPDRAARVLESLAPLDLRLHAAAGLAARGLTAGVARAMRRAGFVTLRLGLETADPTSQQRLGGKVTTDELAAALSHLEQAGYRRAEVGVYVMVGLPGQGPGEVVRGVEQVLALGARPHLAEYSPVPGSPLFAAARKASPHPIADEPLLHNPTLLPCATPELAAELPRIRQRLRDALR